MPVPSRPQSASVEVKVTDSLRPAQPVRTTVSALAALAGARVEAPTGTAEHVIVTGVDLRAQGIIEGDLFAALPGARAHGAEFAADALARGATAILTDEAGFELVSALGSDMPVLVHDDPRGVLGELSATIYGRPSEGLRC